MHKERNSRSICIKYMSCMPLGTILLGSLTRCIHVTQRNKLIFAYIYIIDYQMQSMPTNCLTKTYFCDKNKPQFVVVRYHSI